MYAMCWLATIVMWALVLQEYISEIRMSTTMSFQKLQAFSVYVRDLAGGVGGGLMELYYCIVCFIIAVLCSMLGFMNFIDEKRLEAVLERIDESTGCVRYPLSMALVSQ